jgi:hypothetical protein
MPVENRNGRHIDLSMKRAHSMDRSRKTDSLSMKRTGFMDKSRTTGKKNKL